MKKSEGGKFYCFRTCFSVADIRIKSYAYIVIGVSLLSFGEDMLIELLAVGSGKVYDDIEVYRHALFVKIEAVNLQDIFVGHDVPADIAVYLRSVVVLSVYGVNAYACKNYIVLHKGLFRNAVLQLVELRN